MHLQLVGGAGEAGQPGSCFLGLCCPSNDGWSRELIIGMDALKRHAQTCIYAYSGLSCSAEVWCDFINVWDDYEDDIELM